MIAPLLVLQFVVEHFQQPAGGFFAAQAAQLMQRLPLQVEQFLQFFVAAVGIFDALGQLALGCFDHFLLLAQLLGLLLDGSLAACRATVRVRAIPGEFGQFFFAGGLLLDGHFLDFQLGFFFSVVGIAVRLVDNSFGFAFGILRRNRSNKRTNTNVIPAAKWRGNQNGNGNIWIHGARSPLVRFGLVICSDHARRRPAVLTAEHDRETGKRKRICAEEETPAVRTT